MKHYIQFLVAGIFLTIFIFSCSSDNTTYYNLEVTPAPAEGGTVTPSSGEFERGAAVELTARANDNWLFDGWRGDHSGTSAVTTITMDSDKVIGANFVKQEYTLGITIEGEGEVSQRIVQPKSEEYPHGTVVELTAEPAHGWYFAGWAGDLESEENPETITIEEAAGVTAVFERLEYPITIHVEGEGKVSQQVVQAKSEEYPHGTVLELTGEPAHGWYFAGWKGDLESEENPAQISVDGEKEVTAVFERLEFPLTLEVDGRGEVTQQVLSQPKSTDHTYETIVELTATPRSGWRFVRWEGDLTGRENPAQITIDGEKEVKAVFEQLKHPLVIEIKGEGKVDQKEVQAKSTEDYTHGTVLELTAKPKSGWRFVRWEGDLSGRENPAQITIDGEKEVTAVFEQLEHPLVVEIEGEGDVVQKEVQAKSTDYTHGTVLELTATPKSGWIFARWEGDLSGRENPAQITIDGEKEVKAVFITTPGAPVADGVTTGNRELTVSFDPPADTGGSAITHYEYRLNEDNYYVDIGTDSPFTIKDGENDGNGHYEIINGEEYEVHLRAVNAAGVGEEVSFAPVIPLFYLAENGVTVMCPDASAGDTDVLNGTTYEAVNRAGLDQLISDGADLTSVCTSLVTNMSQLFSNATNFNQDIGNWDVSSVTNMRHMFHYADSFNQDIGSWNVSSVTNMRHMFHYADTFNQAIGGWDVSKVTNMRSMFSQADSFNQDLSGWCVPTIQSYPNSFDTGAANWILEDSRPVWGTCPGE